MPHAPPPPRRCPPKSKGSSPCWLSSPSKLPQGSPLRKTWLQVCGGLPQTSLQIRVPQTSNVPFLHVFFVGQIRAYAGLNKGSAYSYIFFWGGLSFHTLCVFWHTRRFSAQKETKHTSRQQVRGLLGLFSQFVQSEDAMVQ